MRMPGMDGLMVLKQIKDLDETIKVVMLTSAQEEYIVQEARAQGACDYLVKPCNLDEVDALVTALMV
jgi:DNA-binding response OmpR family regulator